MPELFWLLLPIAAASGWLAARRSLSRKQIANLDRTPTYFRGLNYLLNEQQDRAIDLFVNMIEVDNETVETHLALGNLFRRRGEVDRAIRIHQNLIARSKLDDDKRALALLELGKDHMHAGLFDRAESLFQELAEMNHYQEQAYTNLLMIFQQEKDWVKCLTVAQQLEQLTGESHHTEMAHYYCELAEKADRDGNFAEMVSLLREAQLIDSSCVRATILQGQIEEAAGRYEEAIQIYKKVELQDPAYLAEVLPSLLACYQQLGNRNSMIEYLRYLVAEHPGAKPILALTDCIEMDEGSEAALEFITDQMQSHPNLEGLERMLTINLKQSKLDVSDTLKILRQLVKKILVKRTTYQCRICGYNAKSLFWQCPGCKSWSSSKSLT